VFCDAIDTADEPGSLVLLRGQRAYLILNRFPYNSGHLMAVPYEHVASIEEIDAATRAELFELASLAVEGCRQVLRCDGFNLGMNLGEVAGAGVADHIHLHVVPRWTGDANFMPILGETMVMPELLPVTHARLRAEIEGSIAARQHGARRQAGAIVVLPERGAVVLRRGTSGDIVLPKGHVEPGETAAEAALREVREETGIDAAIAGWAGSMGFEVERADGSLERRHIAYFLATGRETQDTATHLEHDTLLVATEDAAARLGIAPLRDLVRRVTPILRQLADTSR
jgi:ATP adenylyltransferase